MKPARQTPQKSRGRSGSNLLLGMFVGLVIGILIAFGVVWYLNRTPLPFQDKVGRVEKPPVQAKPEPLPGKPGDKVGDKPRFEFYKILPGNQEATPAPAAPAAAPAVPAAPAQTPAAPAAEAPPGELFYLQAGSFQKSADADNLKAKLAMMGVEVAVQEAQVPEKGTMYRVRVGPYAKPDEMNRVRNQLAQNGIQATVVKVKETPKN